MASCLSQLELRSYASSVNQRRVLSHTHYLTSTSHPASVSILTNVKCDCALSRETCTNPVLISSNKMDNAETTEVAAAHEIERSKSNEGVPSTNTLHKNRRKRPIREDKGQNISTEESRLKTQKKIFRYETLPGTSLKICKNCGTVAETAKSKKCQNCQKFFYEHWAQRCRIPPCPKCHFSRRSRAREKPPFKCDRCGHLLLTAQSSPERIRGSSSEPKTMDALPIESSYSFGTDEPSSSQLIPTVLNILKICGNQPTPDPVELDKRMDFDPPAKADSDSSVTVSSDISTNVSASAAIGKATLKTGSFLETFWQNKSVTVDNAMTGTVVVKSSVNEDALTDTANVKSSVNEDALTDTANVKLSVNEDALTDTANVKLSVNEDALTDTANVKSSVNENVLPDTAMVKSSVNEDILTGTAMVKSGIAVDLLTDTAMIKSSINKDRTTDTAMFKIDEDVLTDTAMVESSVNKDVLTDTAMIKLSTNEDVLTETAMVESSLDEAVLTDTAMVKPTLNEDVLTETAIVESSLDEDVLTDTAMVESSLNEDVLIETATVEQCVEKDTLIDSAMEVCSGSNSRRETLTDEIGIDSDDIQVGSVTLTSSSASPLPFPLLSKDEESIFESSNIGNSLLSTASENTSDFDAVSNKPCKYDTVSNELSEPDAVSDELGKPEAASDKLHESDDKPCEYDSVSDELDSISSKLDRSSVISDESDTICDKPCKSHVVSDDVSESDSVLDKHDSDTVSDKPRDSDTVSNKLQDFDTVSDNPHDSNASDNLRDSDTVLDKCQDSENIRYDSEHHSESSDIFPESEMVSDDIGYEPSNAVSSESCESDTMPPTSAQAIQESNVQLSGPTKPHHTPSIVTMTCTSKTSIRSELSSEPCRKVSIPESQSIPAQKSPNKTPISCAESESIKLSLGKASVPYTESDSMPVTHDNISIPHTVSDSVPMTTHDDDSIPYTESESASKTCDMASILYTESDSVPKTRGTTFSSHSQSLPSPPPLMPISSIPTLPLSLRRTTHTPSLPHPDSTGMTAVSGNPPDLFKTMNTLFAFSSAAINSKKQQSRIGRDAGVVWSDPVTASFGSPAHNISYVSPQTASISQAVRVTQAINVFPQAANISQTSDDTQVVNVSQVTSLSQTANIFPASSLFLGDVTPSAVPGPLSGQNLDKLPEWNVDQLLHKVSTSATTVAVQPTPVQHPLLSTSSAVPPTVSTSASTSTTPSSTFEKLPDSQSKVGLLPSLTVKPLMSPVIVPAFPLNTLPPSTASASSLSQSKMKELPYIDREQRKILAEQLQARMTRIQQDRKGRTGVEQVDLSTRAQKRHSSLKSQPVKKPKTETVLSASFSGVVPSAEKMASTAAEISRIEKVATSTGMVPSLGAVPSTGRVAASTGLVPSLGAGPSTGRVAASTGLVPNTGTGKVVVSTGVISSVGQMAINTSTILNTVVVPSTGKVATSIGMVSSTARNITVNAVSTVTPVLVTDSAQSTFVKAAQEIPQGKSVADTESFLKDSLVTLDRPETINQTSQLVHAPQSRERVVTTQVASSLTAPPLSPPLDRTQPSSFMKIDVDSPSGHDNIRVSLLTNPPVSSPTQSPTLPVLSEKVKMAAVVPPSALKHTSVISEPRSQLKLEAHPREQQGGSEKMSVISDARSRPQSSRALSQKIGSNRSSPIVIDDIDDAPSTSFVPSLSPIEEEPHSSVDQDPSKCERSNDTSFATHRRDLSKPKALDSSAAAVSKCGPVSTVGLPSSLSASKPSVQVRAEPIGSSISQTSFVANRAEASKPSLVSISVISTAKPQLPAHSSSTVPTQPPHHESTTLPPPFSVLCIPSLLRPSSSSVAGATETTPQQPPKPYPSSIPSLLKPVVLPGTAGVSSAVPSNTMSDSAPTNWPFQAGPSSNLLGTPTICTLPVTEATTATSDSSTCDSTDNGVVKVSVTSLANTSSTSSPPVFHPPVMPCVTSAPQSADSATVTRPIPYSASAPSTSDSHAQTTSGVEEPMDTDQSAVTEPVTMVTEPVAMVTDPSTCHSPEIDPLSVAADSSTHGAPKIGSLSASADSTASDSQPVPVMSVSVPSHSSWLEPAVTGSPVTAVSVSSNVFPVVATRPVSVFSSRTHSATSVLPLVTRPPSGLDSESVSTTSDPPAVFSGVPPTTTDLSGVAKPLPGKGGLVTVQVCSSLAGTQPSEALKVSSSGSYRPAIIRPRPTAAIGGVLIQSLEPTSPDQAPLPKGRGVFVSVLGRSIPSIEVKGQDVSTIGGVSCKSPTNAPAESSRPHKKSGQSGSSGNGERGVGRGGASEGDGPCDDDNSLEDGRDGAGDDREPRKNKKKQSKSSSNKPKTLETMKMFSVKLKDGFFHHLMWGKHRMVFIVPLTDGEVKSAVIEEESHNGSLKSNEGSGGKVPKALSIPGNDRKTRRKAKLEPMIMHEVEEELDPLLESPTTSSAHITTPCFSIYELKNKLFSEQPPNTIYAFTYRHHIKTVKPPQHWHWVLRRMGGVQSSSHTCRLLELKHVQRMVDHYISDSPIPCYLDDFSKNKLPKGRQVIDLSDVEPDDLLNSWELLEEIPQCSVVTRRKKKSLKDSPKEEFDESPDGSKYESRDQSPEDEKSHDKSQDDTVFNEEEEGEEAPLKSSDSSLSVKSKKKKYCPQCGVQIARKSKKCYECGKIFGIFSFGRRLCPGCGHCNLARMSVCFKCGRDLADAPKAIPETSEGFPTIQVCKRPRIDLNDEEDKPSAKVRKEQHFSFSSSAPSSRLPSNADTECSLDEPPGEVGGASDPIVKTDRHTTPIRQTAAQKPSRFSGYQYGRIPWGDADVTCLVDETGTPRFCLPELCSKVLRSHAKSDVLEIVKDLNLPLIQGDFSLLKKLQALGLHSNRSPICRLIGPDELWTLLDAIQERVPAEVHQHLETITMSTAPLLLSPGGGAVAGGVSVQSPALIAACTTVTEDDDHGFESSLHEVECSDGQRIALLRTWNGEQYGSLTEVWRKYFPEVNRNHLTSVLKRLKLETSMPTGQQATLLRNANIISVRGAAGRLMKLEDMQLLLDDLSIPLQISSAPATSKAPPKPPLSQPPIAPPPTHRQRKNSSYNLPPSSVVSRGTAQAKSFTSKEDLQYADCMRNLLQVIDLGDIKQLLEDAHKKAAASTTEVDTESKAACLELDDVQQRISSHRELCNVITDEIGYLNVSNHGFMSEVVRVRGTEKAVFHDLERLCRAHKLSLK